MPTENNKIDSRFDEMLKKNLKQHREPIRRDFTQELLLRIQKLEQQKALAKVILQERLSLAAFIFLPLATVILIFAFPNMVIESTRQMTILYSLIIELVKMSMNHWQLCVYYAMATAAIIYAFYEAILADN